MKLFRRFVRFLLLLPFCWFLFVCGRNETPVEFPDPVTFAVFGNAGLALDNGLEFGVLTAAVNRAGAEFAVDIGNRLPPGIPSAGIEALWDEVDREREKFVVPVYPVAGANDVFDSRSDVVYTGRYGPPWYSFRRGGVYFAVLHTGDESYRHGFGVAPRLGNGQLAWLRDLSRGVGSAPLVILMHHPLWNDAPALWREELLPAVRSARTVLAIAGSTEGLCDWGTVDGIRAVTTGCTGPVDGKGIGLFPHALLVTVGEKDVSFQFIEPDGGLRDGIPVNRDTVDGIGRVLRQLNIPPIDTDSRWRAGQTYDMKISNPLAERVSGEVVFRAFGGTDWTIRPGEHRFDLEPGSSATLHLDIRGMPPELAPQPVYHITARVGDVVVLDREETVKVKIPGPRTGKTVPVEIHTADRIPWDFDGTPVRIPVDVEGADLCGRLAVYRGEGTDLTECLHISPLRDYRPGMNEFVWNGRDIDGYPVTGGPLSFLVYAYNKTAPVTWVANGPPGAGGTFMVERRPAGLTGLTHSGQTLLEIRIGGTMGEPHAEPAGELDGLLGGLAPIGIARDGVRRIFFSTPFGLAAAYTSGGILRPDITFADNGYLRLVGYRGREVGSPVYGGGHLYLPLGGGVGRGPLVLVVDGASGEIEGEIDLEQYYAESAEPPVLAADEGRLWAAHPSEDPVLCLTPEGEVLWANEPGDDIGDRDADGRTFIHGVGLDRFGNAYVCSPGTSARCGVIAPDGRGLFRVILVQLPGLRVSSVWPMIEEKPSDGLYFVTRGGDRPYVFHVPYTIRHGEIAR